MDGPATEARRLPLLTTLPASTPGRDRARTRECADGLHSGESRIAVMKAVRGGKHGEDGVGQDTATMQYRWRTAWAPCYRRVEWCSIGRR